MACDEVERHALTDLCEAIVDCPHSTPVWTSEGVIVLRNQNIRRGRLDLSDPSFTDEAHYQDRTRRIVPRGGDLVITREAPMGEVCEIPSDLKCCLGQRMVLLRPDPARCVPRFLLYALQSPSVRHEILVNEGTGSTVSNLRIPVLESLPIPLLPRRQQAAAAELLGAFDDKIELNRRRNQTLEAMARAIFKSWFVDFDPVKAKAAVRRENPDWTNEQVSRAACPLLDPVVAALFPDRFETSKCGPIPCGWNCGTLDQLVILQRGFDLPTSQRTKGAYPVVAASGPSGTHDQFKVHGPGVTTGRSGLLGGVYYVHEDYWPLNTSLYVKEFRSCGPAYAFHALRLVDFGAFNAGSAVPTLNRNHVHGLPTIVPPVDLTRRFESIAVPLLRRQHEGERENGTLASLRDTLLPKLILGELRLADAERIVGRAL